MILCAVKVFNGDEDSKITRTRVLVAGPHRDQAQALHQLLMLR